MASVFKQVQAFPCGAREFSGWLWTTLRVLVWGTLMMDGYARRGILASEFSQIDFGKEKHSLMPSFLYRIREDSVKWRSRKGETHITDGHI